jgi:hypothetical protein
MTTIPALSWGCGAEGRLIRLLHGQSWQEDNPYWQWHN